MTGTVAAVCLSVRKGTPKDAVPRAELVAGHGLAGDAHAGPGDRQVSILARADIDAFKERVPDLVDGAFGENLVIAGLDLAALGPGSRLAVGAAALRITRLGKDCHHDCAIRRAAGDCIMPRRGLFAVVETGGAVAVGDPVRVLHAAPRTDLPQPETPAMKDVSDRPTTLRRATAEALVTMAPETVAAVREGRVPKGDVAGVTRAVGLLGLKRTPDLLPFCHVIPVDHAEVEVTVEDDGVRVRVSATSVARTGVEVEAMTGAAIAALNVYDMVKPLDPTARLADVHVVRKSGGRSDFRPRRRRGPAGGRAGGQRQRGRGPRPRTAPASPWPRTWPPPASRSPPARWCPTRWKPSPPPSAAGPTPRAWTS